MVQLVTLDVHMPQRQVVNLDDIFEIIPETQQHHNPKYQTPIF